MVLGYLIQNSNYSQCLLFLQMEYSHFIIQQNIAEANSPFTEAVDCLNFLYVGFHYSFFEMLDYLFC